MSIESKTALMNPARSPESRFLRSLSLLAVSWLLLAISVTYTYLASDGWYDVKLLGIAALVVAPFVGFTIWAAFRARRRAKDIPAGTNLSYRSIAWGAGKPALWFAAGAGVIGLIATMTTQYGGLIFLAVIALGAPALAALVFAFSWGAWLFGKRCQRM